MTEYREIGHGDAGSIYEQLPSDSDTVIVVIKNVVDGHVDSNRQSNNSRVYSDK